MMSLITCGKDLEAKKEESMDNKGKEIVIMSPREFIRKPKAGTSRLNAGMTF